MKRLIPFIILALFVGVVILYIIASRAVYSPQQTALSDYLRYYSATAHSLSVKAIVKASRPGSFTASMSGRVFGHSTFFRTDVSYTGDSRANGALQPAPYPPAEVSCVLINSDQGETVVYVALHQDQGSSDWQVHQSSAAWPSGEAKAQLASIGCVFPANP